MDTNLLAPLRSQLRIGDQRTAVDDRALGALLVEAVLETLEDAAAGDDQLDAAVLLPEGGLEDEPERDALSEVVSELRRDLERQVNRSRARASVTTPLRSVIFILQEGQIDGRLSGCRPIGYVEC